MIAAGEKSLLLDKLHHELHNFLPILKTILPFDLVPVTTNSGAGEDVPSPLQERHGAGSVLSPLSRG